MADETKEWERAKAEQIAKALFTNGAGKEADRLVLELPGHKYGGGWCRQALADVIARNLAASPTPAELLEEAIEALRSALCQWRMYAAMDERDLRRADDLESALYRKNAAILARYEGSRHGK